MKEECKCGNTAEPLHTCPYLEEINNDKKLCNCCSECKSNCSDEV